MANDRSSSSASSRGRISASTGRSSTGSSKSTDSVSLARLHQKSGASSAFGGFMKVNHNNGTFSMRKSEK